MPCADDEPVRPEISGLPVLLRARGVTCQSRQFFQECEAQDLGEVPANSAGVSGRAV